MWNFPLEGTQHLRGSTLYASSEVSLESLEEGVTGLCPKLKPWFPIPHPFLVGFVGKINFLKVLGMLVCVC